MLSSRRQPVFLGRCCSRKALCGGGAELSPLSAREETRGAHSPRARGFTRAAPPWLMGRAEPRERQQPRSCPALLTPAQLLAGWALNDR